MAAESMAVERGPASYAAAPSRVGRGRPPPSPREGHATRVGERRADGPHEVDPVREPGAAVGMDDL